MTHIIILFHGANVQNMEGKEIGQKSGFKLAELQDLEVGSRLAVGGKEVMVNWTFFKNRFQKRSTMNGQLLHAVPFAD